MQLHTLAADIGTNGLLNPVVVHEGQVVDGRHRLLACRRAGVEPRFVEWREIYKGDMPLSRWIWSVNAERRIVAAHVLLRRWEECEAARQRQAERQKQGGETAGKGRPKADSIPMNSSESCTAPGPGDIASRPEEKLENAYARDTRAKLAQEIGVSEHKVQQAMNVQKADQALSKEVAKGTTRLREAAKQVRPKCRRRHPPKRSKVPSQGKAQSAESRSAKTAFNLEKLVRTAARYVDELLEPISDAHAVAFLDEFIRELRRMKQDVPPTRAEQ